MSESENDFKVRVVIPRMERTIDRLQAEVTALYILLGKAPAVEYEGGMKEDCPVCFGGKVFGVSCPVCKGTKQVRVVNVSKGERIGECGECHKSRVLIEGIYCSPCDAKMGAMARISDGES